MKKLITLSCIVLFAITAHAQNNGDYRSVKSGNWTDFANVWQKFNGTKWVAATAYPTSANGAITISDTTNVTINLNLTIDQTIVRPGGQLTITSNYTVTLSGTGNALTVNGRFTWLSGSLTSTGHIEINGSLQWGGGNLQTKLTNYGLIDITGNVSVYSVLTNYGTMNWYSNYITYQSGTITNNAVFTAFDDGNMYNGNGGTFTNSGTGIYNQSSGSGTTSSNITFNNKGVMNLNSGIFMVNSGTFTNTKKVVFNGGTFQNQSTSNFNKGTVITGTGDLIEAYNSMNINLDLTLPANVILHITNSGTVGGSGSLTINGNMYWDAGSLNINTSVQSKGIVYISTGNVTLYSTLTNNGVINWSSDYLTFNSGAIVNNKKFNAYGNGILYKSTGGGTFANKAGASFIRQIGNGTVTNQITFTNEGTADFYTGVFYNNGGTFTNTGTIAFNGGTFQNGSTTNFNAGTSITGKGSLVAAYNTTNMNANVTLPANVVMYIENSATVAGTGSLKITGKMYWYAGSLSVPFTIVSSATLSIGNGNVGLYSTLTNNGTVNWLNGYIYFYGGSIVNNNAFNIQTDQYLYKSSSGTFTNSKTGIVTKNSLGITNVTIAFTNAGTISGIGSFAFGTNLSNSGIFAPGINNATGILTTGTNFDNKTLYIKMNDGTPGAGYDRLLVNGNVILGGDTLRVVASDTMPAGSYTILKWTGTRTGTFKVKDLPTGYTVSYVANKVVVTVPTTFANKNEEQTQQDDALKLSMVSKVLSVFPNPATATLNINYTIKNSSATVEVFDVKGKSMLQQVITAGSSPKIDVTKLPAGTYIVLIKDGTASQSTKFIKQ